MQSSVHSSPSNVPVTQTSAPSADPFAARLSQALSRAKQEASQAVRQRVAEAAEEMRRSFAGRVYSQIERPIFASTDDTWCVDSASA